MVFAAAMMISLEGTASATEIGERPFGIGVILGDPSGLSAKYYLGGRANAIDAALAFDTTGANNGWMYLHASYLWHPSVLSKSADVEFPWHVGVGGFVATNQWSNTTGNAIGVRVPIGIDADLEKVPVQFFADVALHVVILPATGVDFDVGIGVRFYP